MIGNSLLQNVCVCVCARVLLIHGNIFQSEIKHETYEKAFRVFEL